MDTTATALLGRLIAAVGIVLGIVAIWVDYLPGNRYGNDGTSLVWLLALAIISAGLLMGAVATGRSDLDVAAGAVGGIMFGTYLLVPVLTAFDRWDQLDTGAWLGMCSGLTVVGAIVASVAPPAKTAVRPASGGMFLSLVGLVVVFAGIFPEVTKGEGSYWNAAGLGHSAGIFLIIVCALGVLLLGAAGTGQSVGDWLLLLSGIIFGFTMTVVVHDAFNQIGNIRVGGWLAAAGGLITFIGAWALRQMATTAAEAPTTPAVPPPA